MRIGELSRATGASTRALRYYEEQGLIASDRLANRYRDYPPEVIGTVEFIQDLLAAGVSSSLLREIVPCLADDGQESSCTDLTVKVQQVRDTLLDQERRIRTQRITLEQYLGGQRHPRGHARGAVADMTPAVEQWEASVADLWEH